MSTYFDYTFYEPGASVAGIDTVITDIETALNDLPVEAVTDRAIGRDHFGAGMGIISTVLSSTIGDLALTQGSDSHIYTEGVEAIDYAGFGTHGSADRHIVGAGSSYTGIEAVIDGFAHQALGTGTPLSRADHFAMWVKGNVQVSQVSNNTQVTSVMICVQVGYSTTSTGTVTWRTVPRTERFVSTPDHVVSGGSIMGIDVPIKTLITSADIPGVYFRGVRLMVSAGGPVTGTGASITLNRWNLTAIPIRIVSQ